MGLMGLLMACYEGLWGILSGLTKSTDHPSKGLVACIREEQRVGYSWWNQETLGLMMRNINIAIRNMVIQ